MMIVSSVDIIIGNGIAIRIFNAIASYISFYSDGFSIGNASDFHSLDGNSLFLIQPNWVLVEICESFCCITVEFVQSCLKAFAYLLINDFVNLQVFIDGFLNSEYINNAIEFYFRGHTMRVVLVKPKWILLKGVFACKGFLGVVVEF